MANSKPIDLDTSSITTPAKKQRLVFCGRCMNHGILNPLKGHKKYCPKRNCLCNACFILLVRQKATAHITAASRQKKLEMERKKLPGEVSILFFR